MTDPTCSDCGKFHPIMLERTVTVLKREIVEKVCSPCLREALETKRLRETRGVEGR